MWRRRSSRPHRGRIRLDSNPSLGIAAGLYSPVMQVTGLTNFGGGLNGTSFGNYWFTTWQMSKTTRSGARGSIRSRQGSPFSGFVQISCSPPIETESSGSTRCRTFSSTGQRLAAGCSTGDLTPRALRQSVLGCTVKETVGRPAIFGVNIGLRLQEPASIQTELSGKLANLRTLGAPANLLRRSVISESDVGEPRANRDGVGSLQDRTNRRSRRCWHLRRAAA